MDKQSQRFSGPGCSPGIVLAAAVAVFNACDPYLVLGAPRIVGLNARKPAVDTQQRLMKAYDVLRAAPNTVILGGSRVDLGAGRTKPRGGAEVQLVECGSAAEAEPFGDVGYSEISTSARLITRSCSTCAFLNPWSVLTPLRT